MMEAPGPGGRVRDSLGRMWVNTGFEERQGGSDWELEDAASFEPESWTRVCEFGPLTVLH